MTGYTNGNSVITAKKATNGATGNGNSSGTYTATENALQEAQQQQQISPADQTQLVLNEEKLVKFIKQNKIIKSPAFYSYEIIQEIADYLKARTDICPKIGIICGSGLNSLADHLVDTCAFDYESIPNFPLSTVEGHVGRLVFGHLEGLPVVCMQGRFHFYEGYPLAKCSMPVRVMKLLGVSYLIATNAAGGLNPKFKVGDLMIVRDHINIMGFAGNNPLQGPNDPRFGPRFPPMTNAYDAKLVKKARKIVKEMGVQNDVHEGVYTCLGGPNYESVAELKMLRTMGVDAVGMSTVHEVITARHCDMTVFAFSLITNKCATDYNSSDDEANHEEVVMVGKKRQNTCGEVVCRMVKAIGEDLNNQKE